MVVDGCLNRSGSPSFPRIFHSKHSLNAKCPCSSCEEQGQNGYSAVPPCLPGNPGHSVRCQHTVCPITPAMRQKILWLPISPCPRRPIYQPAFRAALSFAALSVDALMILLPLHRFMICYALYTRYVCVCQALFCVTGGQA